MSSTKKIIILVAIDILLVLAVLVAVIFRIENKSDSSSDGGKTASAQTSGTGDDDDDDSDRDAQDDDDSAKSDDDSDSDRDAQDDDDTEKSNNNGGTVANGGKSNKANTGNGGTVVENSGNFTVAASGSGSSGKVNQKTNTAVKGNQGTTTAVSAKSNTQISLPAGTPEEFVFCSGVGGWSTELKLEKSGFFTGYYHDTESNEQKVYYCKFNGKFGNIKKLNTLTYSMNLVNLEVLTEKGSEEKRDGMTWVGSDPYGFDDGGYDYILYLPGTPVKGLNDTFLSWVKSVHKIDGDRLGCFAIYDKSGSGRYGFVGVESDSGDGSQIAGNTQKSSSDRSKDAKKGQTSSGIVMGGNNQSEYDDSCDNTQTSAEIVMGGNGQSDTDELATKEEESRTDTEEDEESYSDVIMGPGPDDEAYACSGDYPDDALYVNGHHYYIYDDVESSWEEAYEKCVDRGGRMAVISDAELNECLFEYMLDMGYDSAYFGLRQYYEEDDWYYYDGDVTFLDWGYNSEGVEEPNNSGGGEMYAQLDSHMSGGHWNDARFGKQIYTPEGEKYKDRYAYICEWEY